MNKTGPKTKSIYLCTCCNEPKTFSTAKKKCDHERNSRKKESKTEVPKSWTGNLDRLDDVEIPTTKNLK